MKKKLAGNIPLKIMSIVVGILVWLIVVNVDDPMDRRTFTVPDVEVLNIDYPDEITGKMCVMDEKENPVRVTISAQKKTLNKIDISDIHAVADLQQALSFEPDQVMVPIVVTCAGIRPENISVWPVNLGVRMEDKVTQHYPVNAVTEGDPGKGYEIGTVTSNPEKIRITGPESLMNKIDRVTASISVAGSVEDKREAVTLKITDKNGEDFSDSQMNNLKIDYNSKVTVTAKLWRIRTDVKISAGYTGEPAQGYQVEGSAETVPATVSVVGSEEALQNLEDMGNTIWIPDIDITDKSQDVEEKASLSELLEEDLRLTNGTSDDVWISIKILPEGSHSYSLATSEIKAENVPEKKQVAFETDKIEISVKTAGEDIDKFDIKKVKASIDLDGMEEGSYEIPVEIVLPDGYELMDEVTTEVKISEVSNVEESNE